MLTCRQLFLLCCHIIETAWNIKPVLPAPLVKLVLVKFSCLRQVRVTLSCFPGRLIISRFWVSVDRFSWSHQRHGDISRSIFKDFTAECQVDPIASSCGISLGVQCGYYAVMPVLRGCFASHTTTHRTGSGYRHPEPCPDFISRFSPPFYRRQIRYTCLCVGSKT